MHKKQDQAEAKAALRRAAEARFKAKPATQRPQTEADQDRLLFELSIHQIELEMQNEELQASHDEIEAGLERYSELFDFAPVGYFDLTADGTIGLVNLAGANLVGLERARLPGRCFQDWLTEPDRTAFSDLLQRVFATKTRQALDITLLKPDQTRLHAHLEAHLSSDGGSCHLALSDITERQQAEVALQESEAKFRELAENINDVFWISTPDLTKIIYVSPAYETILGRPVGNLYENPQAWHEAIHPEDRAQVRACFQQLAAGVPGASMEYRVVRPDGTVRWVHDRGFLVRDSSGKVARAAGVAKDITEHKRVEAQNRQLQKAESLSRMAGAIAHNFNNQLAAVILNLELLQQERPPQAGPDLSLAEAVKSARKAANISTQMLVYLGQAAAQREPLDLSEACRQSLPLLQPANGEPVRGGDFRRGRQFDGQANGIRSVTARFPGVGEQVGQHLLNPVSVGFDHRPGRGQVGLEGGGVRVG